MIERIKLLALQSGLFSARPSGTRTRVMLATIPDTAGEIGDPDTQLEKFAELIVRECIKSIQSDMDRETMNGTISLAKHAGMVSAKTVIKKHFGVE